MFLYCVFNGKEIIGRFKNSNKAVKYRRDCESNGMKEIRICSMTIEQYYEYMEKYLSYSKF